MEWKKQLTDDTSTNRGTAFPTSYTKKQLITLLQWGYSGSRSPRAKPKQALCVLICCGQYMAVSMPGHSDLIDLIMSRMVLYSTLRAPTVCIPNIFITSLAAFVRCISVLELAASEPHIGTVKIMGVKSCI